MKIFATRPSRVTRQQGFTLIELVIVIVILGILLTLVAATYSGVQAKNRNSKRQANIDQLQSALEQYAVPATHYPTLVNLNDPVWVSQNLKKLDLKVLQDPGWTTQVKTCTVRGKAVVVSTPTANCIAYQATTTDGNPCDNLGAICAQYTLTALLEGGTKYVKSSLN